MNPESPPDAPDETRGDPKGGLTIERKLLAGFLSTILVLVIAIFSFAGLSSLHDSRAWARHTRDVIQALHDARLQLLNTEIRYRGYLITGGPAFLAQYTEGARRLEASLLRVTALTEGDLDQQANAAQLTTKTNEKLVTLALTIPLIAEGKVDEAEDMIGPGNGRLFMEDEGNLLDEMIGREEALLTIGKTQQERTLLVTMMATGGGSIIAVLLGIFVNIAIRRDVLQQKRSWHLIELQTARLEQQTTALRETGQALASRLSETRTLANHLSAANHKLEETNRDLDQFAYHASHDLKAPLRGIANISEWLEDDLAAAMTNQSRDQLRLLRGRVHRMEALLDGILTYSRAGRTKKKLERLDVGAAVASAVELLDPKRGLVLIDVASRIEIESEAAPLQQVLVNLVGNALKHGATENPHVVVVVKDMPSTLEFSVSDNGPGIDVKYHERIFRMFQTLASRDRVEGAGVGLAVVKKLVEARGGNVRVESELGCGATFSFSWPKARMGRGDGLDSCSAIEVT